MLDKKYTWMIPTLFIVVVFIVYFLTAPFTIQAGDTGELVTNSFFLRVSHPPGYPLWTLLYHLPLKYLGHSNPFYAASIMTILISLTWIGLIMAQFKDKQDLLILGVLTSSLVIWRYSILPDVFSLHALFITLVLTVFVKPELLTKPLMIFLISLSVAHHHTILFVFPMFVYAIYKKPLRSTLVWSVVFGLTSISLYLLLLSFHPAEYGSHSMIQSFSDVLDHFLRKEYGTLTLQKRLEEGHSWILFFINSIVTNAWSVLIVLFFLIYKYPEVLKVLKDRLLILISCLVVYFLVFSMLGNISFDQDGQLVSERFLIQPTLIVFFITFLILKEAQVKLPNWLYICLVGNIGLNLGINYQAVDYSKNTSLEDYLENSLNSIPSGSIYYTYGDSAGFGTYYLKDIKKIRPDILHMHPTWGFKWGPAKFMNNFPGVLRVQDESIFKSVNLQTHRFFTNFSPSNMPPGHTISMHGLLFEISTFKGEDAYQRFNCDHKYQWKNRPEIQDFAHYDVVNHFDLKYGMCHFAQGLELMAQQNWAGAVPLLLRSLELSPHNAKVMERLCFAYKSLNDPRAEDCSVKFTALIYGMDQQYYLEKYD